MSDPYSILIVDDDPRNVEILKLKLESEGFSTETAVDGESALIKYESQRPNMVLLDVMMPGLDGKQVCALLKERSQGFFVPVLLITALTTEDSMVQGFDAGADDYLKKPINFQELSARIKNLQKIQRLMSKPMALPPEMSTHERVKGPADTVLKTFADRMKVGKKLLFQVRMGEQTGYVCTHDDRFVYARADGLNGSEALERILVWESDEIEVIAAGAFNSNLDRTFEEVLTNWMQRIDMWRTVSEKLSPASTFLVRNPEKQATGLKPASTAMLGAFDGGLYIDAALRHGGEDVISGLGHIVELYYAGYLLKETPSDAKSYVVSAPPASNPAMREELEGLRNAVTEARLDAEKILADAIAAGNERDQLQGERVASENERSRLQSELDSLKQLYSDLMAAKSTLAAQNEAVESKVQVELQAAKAVEERLRAEIESMKTKEANVQTELASSMAAHVKLQVQAATAKANEEKLQAELTEAKATQERLQTALNVTKTDQGGLELAVAESKAAQARLETEFAESQSARQNLQTYLQSALEAKEHLESDLAGAKTKFEQLQSEHAAAKVAHERSMAEGHSHKNEHERLLLEIAGMKKEMAQSASKITELGNALSSSQTVREMLQAELEEMKASYAEELKVQSQKASENLGSTHESADARETLARQTSEIGRLSTVLSEKERTVTALQAELETSQQSVSTVQLELEHVRQEYEASQELMAADKSFFERRLAEMQSDIEAHAAELKATREEIQIRREEFEALTKKSNALSQDLILLQESTDFAQRQMGEQLQTVQALQAYKKLLEEELKPLRVELETKNAALKDSQELLAKKEAELLAAHQQPAAMDDDLPADTDLLETYENTQKEVERLEGELMLALGELEEAKEVSDTKAPADNSEVETLRARLAEAENLIKKAHDAFLTKDGMLKEQSLKVSRLEAENKTLQASTAPKA